MSKEVEEKPYKRKSLDYVTPTGIKTTLYSISTLAERLGRTSQTVRKWEIGGIIPPTPFRIKGVRYYSEEHIQAIVNSAEKSKIKNGKAIGSTQFSNRCYKEFEKLSNLFFKV